MYCAVTGMICISPRAPAAETARRRSSTPGGSTHRPAPDRRGSRPRAQSRHRKAQLVTWLAMVPCRRLQVRPRNRQPAPRRHQQQRLSPTAGLACTVGQSAAKLGFGAFVLSDLQQGESALIPAGVAAIASTSHPPPARRSACMPVSSPSIRLARRPWKVRRSSAARRNQCTVPTASRITRLARAAQKAAAARWRGGSDGGAGRVSNRMRAWSGRPSRHAARPADVGGQADLRLSAGVCRSEVSTTRNASVSSFWVNSTCATSARSCAA